MKHIQESDFSIHETGVAVSVYNVLKRHLLIIQVQKSRTIRQEQEIKGIRIGKKNKMFLFTDKVIFVGRKS